LYVNRFFGNLVFGENNKLQSREMHMSELPPANHARNSLREEIEHNGKLVEKRNEEAKAAAGKLSRGFSAVVTAQRSDDCMAK
jgi:hypothetical protein